VVQPTVELAITLLLKELGPARKSWRPKAKTVTQLERIVTAFASVLALRLH
jgi:hypothetical protein